MKRTIDNIRLAVCFVLVRWSIEIIPKDVPEGKRFLKSIHGYFASEYDIESVKIKKENENKDT